MEPLIDGGEVPAESVGPVNCVDVLRGFARCPLDCNVFAVAFCKALLGVVPAPRFP